MSGTPDIKDVGSISSKHVKLKKRAQLQKIVKVNNEETYLIRLEDVIIDGWRDDTKYGRSEFSLFINISDEQKKSVQVFEKELLAGLLDTEYCKYVITQNIIDNYRGLTTDGNVIKVKITSDKSAFLTAEDPPNTESEEAYMEWPQPSIIPKDIYDLYISGKLCEYAVLSPNVIYMQEGGKIGISWLLRNIKASKEKPKISEMMWKFLKL